MAGHRRLALVIASVLIHIVYFAALIESYAAGDMGLVYPLARGSAPLMTAIGAAVWLQEHSGCSAGSASRCWPPVCCCCRCAAAGISPSWTSVPSVGSSPP